MSTNVPQNQEDQEIDLFQVFKNVGRFLKKINTGILDVFSFL
jgi:hypothetical protein